MPSDRQTVYTQHVTTTEPTRLKAVPPLISEPVHKTRPNPQNIIRDLQEMLRELDQKAADDEKAFQMALSDPGAPLHIRERLYVVIMQRARLRDDLVARLAQTKFLAFVLEGEEDDLEAIHVRLQELRSLVRLFKCGVPSRPFTVYQNVAPLGIHDMPDEVTPDERSIDQTVPDIPTVAPSAYSLLFRFLFGHDEELHQRGIPEAG